MPVSEGQLNGSRDYRVKLDIWFSGAQDWGVNTSRFDWRVTLDHYQSIGSWTNNTCEVWATIGGVPYYGTFTIPQSTANQQSRVVLSGSTWIGHDGEGFRPGFASDAYIKAPHSYIGEGGSGQAWVDAPRIPKTPTAPRNLRVESKSPISAGIRYDGPADWRGSSPQGYTADWYEINGANNPLVWRDLNSQGYTDPQGGAVPGAPQLKPGTTYHVYIYARSNVGNSPSASIALTTDAGGRVKVDGQWRNATPWVKQDGVWRRARPYVKDGGSFRTAR